jgi:hypothetical protein
MTESNDRPVDESPADQDSEPSLNAPGDAGPTGVDAGEEATEASGAEDRDVDDQDAEPSLNAPGEGGPTGTDASAG